MDDGEVGVYQSVWNIIIFTEKEECLICEALILQEVVLGDGGLYRIVIVQ